MKQKTLSSLLGLLMLGAFATAAQAQEDSYHVQASADSTIWVTTHGSTTLNTQLDPLSYSLINGTFTTSTMQLDVATNDATKGMTVVLTSPGELVGQATGATLPLSVSVGGSVLAAGTNLDFTAANMAWDKTTGSAKTTKSIPLVVTSPANTAVSSDHYSGAFTLSFLIKA